MASVSQVIMALITDGLTVAVLIAMSLHANHRFQAQRDLPMQWWLDGSVTWRAPRPLALAFMPALAAACLSFIAAMTLLRAPRLGQEGLMTPIIVVTALLFVACHALHLWLMKRTIGR